MSKKDKKKVQAVSQDDTKLSERSDQRLGSPKASLPGAAPVIAAVGAAKYGPYGLVALVLTAIIGGGVYYYHYRGLEVVYENLKFDFYTLCPAIYAFQNISTTTSNKEYAEYIDKYRQQLQNTYIVTAKAGQQLTKGSNAKFSQLRIRYCGLAKRGNGTCENDAIFMCSNPGPYFDVQENQQIKVVWVNDYINLNQPNSSQTRNSYDLTQGFSENNCFNPVDDPKKRPPSQMCNKTAKSKDDFDLLLFDPTNKIPVDTDCQVQNIKQVDTFPVQSTRYAVPLSPHVHGLEVEPYYDGNPLSWFDSNGNIGIGYYVTKADEEDYIKNQLFKTILKQLGIRGMNMKINVYKNVQQPGTLWYHDHSMGVTGLNVRLGLHSFYIIRNKKAEKDLPSGQFQRIIMMYTGMRNPTSGRNCSKQCDPNFSSDQCNQCLISKQPNKENEDVPLLLNTTYRIRILNGDFRSQFAHIRFILSTCKIQPRKDQNCTEQIPFSVIGTDSTLRRQPVNVNNISLSPAERIDILITINPSKIKFTNQSKLHVISDRVSAMDKTKLNFTKLAEYNVTNKRKGEVVNIKQIDVPWVDLSKVDESQIIGKRMRSLFFTSDFTFGINLHPRFSEGLSQNPKIGTIEDWYIVNTVFQPHPIHVHLIQFQAIEIVALKRFKYVGPYNPNKQNHYDCSYYLMDAIKRQAQSNKKNGIPVDNKLQQALNDLQKLCFYSQNVMDATKYSQLFKHKKDEQTFVNRVSGLDVFEKCASAQQCLKYGEKKGSTNKYIDPSVNMSQYLQDYQKGWKETFWVPEYAYAKLRMRWTSTDFPQQLMNPLNPQKSVQGCKRGYFHLPQENITQSPGYVYHCHILDHEDNEMMRPIMVQPSGCNNIPTWRERWQEKYCQFKEKKLQRSRQKKANGELRVL